ncbi:Hypothetical_protein [Hexamita inflata]|uniref:Hypothetical_protein n=1 Tax=Hexamita inflata TaxID=28002 RepID=A0AA86U2G8_9EUKA|nr:Hypothetical protein HINF_LOCUS23342 [Hexamita inflata]
MTLPDNTLKQMYSAEEFLQKILFYDFEQCKQLLKTATTLTKFHASQYYCHYAQTNKSKNMSKKNTTTKNNCTRRGSVVVIRGSTIYSRKLQYQRFTYVTMQDSNLYALDKNRQELDKNHTYWQINFRGQHDGGDFPCCEQQSKHLQFCEKDLELIQQNLNENQGMDKIRLLLKQNQVSCSYEQLYRRAHQVKQQGFKNNQLLVTFAETILAPQYEKIKW